MMPSSLRFGDNRVASYRLTSLMRQYHSWRRTALSDSQFHRGVGRRAFRAMNFLCRQSCSRDLTA